MTRALITGGSGFIGSALADTLEEFGVEVLIFDRSSGYNNDILHAGILRGAVEGSDVVFHLAGLLGTHELFDNVSSAIDVNCHGTLNVLEACRHTGAAYVGVTMPQVFPSVYTATKVFGTRLASAYHREYGIPVSHVRAFNAFGPGQKWGSGHPQKIVPTFALAAWRGDPLPVWGSGEQAVDLVHTADLARLFYLAWQKGGDDFTVDGGSGTALSVNEIGWLIADHCDQGSKLIHLPMRRGEEPTHICAEGWGWERLDGWRPKFHESDLLDTVNWYKQHA